MPALTPKEFVAKWGQVQLKETAASQSHFNDICALIGHKPPVEYDPKGDTFTFEAHTDKAGGQKGFADVYFRDHFIWEYKGPHADLIKAYQQLQLYRESLSNPPLLITSDLLTIYIHTNFNNYPRQTHEITLDDILDGSGVEKLNWAFYKPENFKPEKNQEQITKATAETFMAVANAMKQHQQLTGESYKPEQLAHFLVRLLFALFAEDMGLLPDNLFTQIVKSQGGNYAALQPVLKNLFTSMRTGGTFGVWPIRYFDGTLFDDDFVPEIPYDLGKTLLQAANQDWSSVDPSIFGTLFERIIDESKRAQLGAHYTSEDDIMLIVEPVLMAPLRQKWIDTRQQANQLLLGALPGTDDLVSAAHAHKLLDDFAQEIAAVRVLDSACGSGNFLYVALRLLLDLQKEVIAYAARKELPPIELTVSPQQLYGIEINPYAHELAQITVWIGYLQWRYENGFGDMADPILRPLKNIKHMDAILAYDETGQPVEPEWPAADVIIGNPPFLGHKKMRTELGNQYALHLRELYQNRITGRYDLVCLWFEKSRFLLESGKTKRVGLLATNSLRKGASRHVLDQISQTGNIFEAWSDRPWILDGAAVRVSIVAFDDGTQKHFKLDGKVVKTINPDLTSASNLTLALTLVENSELAFIGTQKSGDFDITDAQARIFLQQVNEDVSCDNKDVVKPWINALDIARRPRQMWIIDFDEKEEAEALKYHDPYQYVLEKVKPYRMSSSTKGMSEKWWLLWRSRPAMKKAISELNRYIVTPLSSQNRIFKWVSAHIIPENLLTVIATDSDYNFGVLHSRVHELWSIALGTSLGVSSAPRYTPSTCFETFPFPWPPGQEPSEAGDARVKAIADWARALVAWREAWLNPPPPQAGTIDVAYENMLKKRTLTNLYNGLQYYRETIGAGGFFLQSEFDKVTRKSVSRSAIEELHDIHTALDYAVLDAYGWPHALTDEQILEHLLALNLQRATGQT